MTPSELKDLMKRHVATFRTRVPDWDALSDARLPGYRRAQLRYIGAGASGKQDSHSLPASHFTLSVMYVPQGEGSAPHVHEVEEVFFVLQGHMVFFLDDEDGNRVEETLGPWDCISCPANVIRGFHNRSLEPVYMAVMLGTSSPELMTFVDPRLQARRDDHLK